MKTWQVIKELTENPNKRFTFKENNNNSYVAVEDGKIVWRGEHQEGQNLNIGFIDDRGREWEEAQPSVTWIEAIQAWKKGKPFRIEYDGIVYIQKYYNKLGCLDIKGNTRTFNGIEYGMIEHGKWYIED